MMGATYTYYRIATMTYLEPLALGVYTETNKDHFERMGGERMFQYSATYRKFLVDTQH